MLKAGSSTVLIDIELPALLEGHISRLEPATTVLDPLAATAVAISIERNIFVVVSIDALEFESSFVVSLRSRISAQSGIPSQNVMIAATHTHTAPATIKLGTLPPNDQFLAAVTYAALTASSAALQRLEPCELRLASTIVDGLGVNRRRVHDGTVSMAPNPAGTIDDKLTTLAFYRNGVLIAALVSYSMHPTTLSVGISTISADYPGAFRERLKARFPNADVAFLTGACGDVRPNVIDCDHEFREGTPSDVQRIGRRLCDAMIHSLKHARKLSGAIPIGTDTLTVNLPFAYNPNTMSYGDLAEDHETRLRQLRMDETRPDSDDSFARHINPRLMEKAFRDWARDMAERADQGELQNEVPVELQALTIGDKLGIIALPLEVFAETGLAIKEQSPTGATMLAAYSNGSLGYVPTTRAFDLGGYEVEQAYKLYGLPAPYARDAADRIVEAGISALRAAFDSRTG